MYFQGSRIRPVLMQATTLPWGRPRWVAMSPSERPLSAWKAVISVAMVAAGTGSSGVVFMVFSRLTITTVTACTHHWENTGVDAQAICREPWMGSLAGGPISGCQAGQEKRLTKGYDLRMGA